MAHITEFTVDGLAGRKDIISHKLNRDINVFFGLNGSGKTSLLKILHSALANNAAILRDVPFRTATVKIYSINYNSVFTNTIERPGHAAEPPQQTALPGIPDVIVEETSRKITSQASVKAQKWTIGPKKPDVRSWAHRYLPTTRLWGDPRRARFEEEHSREMVDWERQIDKVFELSVTALWSDYMSKINRAVRDAQEEGLADILKTVLISSKKKTDKQSNISPDLAYERVKAFLSRQASTITLPGLSGFEKKYVKDAVLRQVAGTINEVESRIDTAMIPRNKLQSLIQSMFNRKTISFTENSIDVLTDTKSPISLAALSSGEKQVLNILIETLGAEKNTIIIDEPELSMHVDWQLELIPSMQSLNSSAQLILATHSPEVMTPVADDKIFHL